MAVRCRVVPDSETEGEAEQVRTIIEELVGAKKRVSVVPEGAEARVLLDVELLRLGTNSDAGWFHRIRMIDTKHNVLVFENAKGHGSGELASLVKWELEAFAPLFEKPYLVASQVE